MRTLVIGEAGSCHSGDLTEALELIRIAAEAGADVCKFQWVSSAQSLSARRRAPEYLRAYQLIEFPFWWHERLKSECERQGLEYMCTAYLKEDLEKLSPYVSRWKIASFENRDLEFMRAHVSYGKPIIISAGMDGRTGHVHGDAEVYWLHCVSSYPTPVDQINLGLLRTGQYDGLSDHTRCVFVGALAVAAGAEIVETHFRTDSTRRDNADYAPALSPYGFHEYVDMIRMAEKAMGNGLRGIQECEKPMEQYRVQP